MIVIDPLSFHAHLDRVFGFVGFEQAQPIPHQSLKARFPGASLAAQDLGVHRGHLHRVLTGERTSHTLLARWKAWLKQNPQFARLQH